MGILNDIEEVSSKKLEYIENINLQGGNTKTVVFDYPFEWSSVKFSVKLFQIYSDLVILRNHSGSSHYTFMWGDSLTSTTTWKYQYVGEIEILNPSDSQVDIHFKRVGYYTFSGGIPPSSWTNKNNQINYKIESVLIR